MNCIDKFSKSLWIIALLILSTGAHAVVKCPTSSESLDRFALCATAMCWTLDGVSYCKCDIKEEESISLSFSYYEGGTMKNVCDLLVQGNSNGFTISTYATPPQALKGYDARVEKEGPAKALYDCNRPGYSTRPAYSAQCDGGVCFNSTTNSDFPGLGHVKSDQIVCSCPPTPNKRVFQIAGPWNCAPGEVNVDNRCCDKEFYKTYCGVRSIKRTGTILPVGSAVGSAVGLSTLLDGQPPMINVCRF